MVKSIYQCNVCMKIFVSDTMPNCNHNMLNEPSTDKTIDKQGELTDGL